MENQAKDHLSYAKKAPEATPWIASQSLFDPNIKKCFLIKGSTVIKANIAANGIGLRPYRLLPSGLFLFMERIE